MQEIAHKENLDLTAFKLDILVEADRNLVSSYKWMYKKSYFKNYLPKLQIQEEKIWDFLELKTYKSIVKQYVRTVEDKHLKAHYTAPWYMAAIVQLGRILGM